MTSLWFAHATPFASDTFVPGDRFDVIVLGAGLTGLVSAVVLARAGKKVALLEAREVGAATTGHTTAKLSLLHGAKMAALLREHGPGVATAYARANRAGQEWLVDFCREHGVAVEQRDAYTYASERSSSSRIQEEVRACQAAGLDVEHTDTPELPFPTHGAVRLRGQYQFNPLDVLHALVDRFRALGGVLVTGQRATSITEGNPLEIVTDRGSWFAPDVVIATGFPVLAQQLLSARLEPHRSYIIAVRTGGEKPQGMYLSLEAPKRSLRTARVAEEDYLLVGGQGHIVGREHSAKTHVAALFDWTVNRFGDATLAHSWSAQDYRELDELPLLVSWNAGDGRAFFGTGYDKWGMTNGAATALALAGRVLGTRPASWASLFERPCPSARATGRAFLRNGKVALEMARGWGAAWTAGRSAPSEGEGQVTHEGLKPIGSCRVQGTAYEVSAVCTHLGGVLHWNDAERSWDCPLHGSRFSHDGQVLEGPATHPLERH